AAWTIVAKGGQLRNAASDGRGNVAELIERVVGVIDDAAARISQRETIAFGIEGAGNGEAVLFGFFFVAERIVFEIEHGDVVAGHDELRCAVILKEFEGGRGGDV